MKATEVDTWLAEYFKGSPLQIDRLLRDGTAVRFLIAWALFESRCFDGYVRIHELSNFAKEATQSQRFRRDAFLEAGKHFHDRYQDRSRYRHLMHSQNSEEMESILKMSFNSLDDYHLFFMLLLVVYRYRNNIFHGNKGVESWLHFRREGLVDITSSTA